MEPLKQSYGFMHFMLSRRIITFTIESMKQESEPSSEVTLQLGKITIAVSDPEARKEYGGAKQYYLYNLKGRDQKGDIDIQRRYSDFEVFRATLVKKWPGAYIPSLPSKLKITHSDEEFLELRSNYFQKFLIYFVSKPYIWYSEEMQFFLKNKDMNCEKVMGSFAKVDFHELLYRYKTNFDSKQEDDDEKAAELIDEFDKLLRSLFLSVQQLRNKGEQSYKIQSKYQSKYSKCLLNLLAKYEGSCISAQFEGNIEEKQIRILSQNSCLSKREQLQDYLKQTSGKLLFEEIKREKRQILGFQEALREREDYRKKKAKLVEKIKSHEQKITQLANGKQSLISKLRKGSAEEQMKGEQNIISNYKSQLEDYTQLCKYIDSLLTKQIIVFKQERIASYYNLIKDLMRSELELIQKEKQFWKLIASQNEFSFEIQEAMKIKNFSSPLKKTGTEEELEKRQQNRMDNAEKKQQEASQKAQDLKVTAADKKEQKLEKGQQTEEKQQNEQKIKQDSNYDQFQSEQSASPHEKLNQQPGDKEINEIKQQNSMEKQDSSGQKGKEANEAASNSAKSSLSSHSEIQRQQPEGRGFEQPEVKQEDKTSANEENKVESPVAQDQANAPT